MKLHAESAILDQSGLTEQTQFRVNTNSAKLFDILQNSMYTDKILAPVREYLCNALDAHKEVGNSAPFDVYLPNSNVPEWVVRDYGPGLSHDGIMGLFTTYLMSSKDGSNDQIGGFGLGSKSAFAYTDQFTVVSFYNGVATRYVCYIDDHRMPAVSVVDKQNTTESNGLAIRIPVKKDDMQSFYHRTQKILQFFPAGSYKVFGTTIKPYEPTHKTPEMWVTNNVHHYNGEGYAFLLMGNVRYDIPTSFAANNELLETMTQRRTEVTLIADIGDCSLSPSRETLSLDKRTVAWLTDRCKKIYDELQAAAKAQLASANNPFEYGRLANKLRNQNAAAFVPKYSKAPWGVFCDDKFDIKHRELYEYSYYITKGPMGGPPRLMDKDWRHGIPVTSPVCLAATDGKTNLRLKILHPQLVLFTRALPGFYRLYADQGPVAVIVTKDQCLRDKIVPDFKLDDVTLPPKPPKGPKRRFVRSFSQKARVDINDLPSEFAYVIGDVLEPADQKVVFRANGWPNLHRTVQFFAVPKIYTKDVQDLGGLTIDELRELRCEELEAVRDELRSAWVAQKIKDRDTTPFMIRDILGIPGLPADIDRYMSYNARQYLEPDYSEDATLDAYLQSMYASFDAYYKPLFDQVDEKLLKNDVVCRIIAQLHNDPEAVEYMKALME